MACQKEITDYPILLGCPGDAELFLVRNAIGGYSPTGAGTGWAWRSWAYIKACVGGASLPPYVGVVDRGNPTDPVSNTSIFQSDDLKGLGLTNNYEIQIVYGEQLRSSFGLNKSFNYDHVAGIIDLDYNGSAEQWSPGASLWTDRNQ